MRVLTSVMTHNQGLLERLAKGPVVGDGSMCMTLEKRGYCRAGPWTPEAVIQHPHAVRQLLREYLRAGADVLQTPCFYSSDEKLQLTEGVHFTTTEVNSAACKMAREVANEGDAIVCGALSPVLSFSCSGNNEKARKEFQTQLIPFIEHEVDFILAEFFNYIEELEICMDVIKSVKKPTACTMRIGPMGDENGVSVEECAIRMAKTGAHLIGINCLFDVNTTLKTLKRMKAALDQEGLTPYLMCQPLGWMCPEVENEKMGYLTLPDTPLSLDSRQLTRSEVHKFTRAAYDIGVRYIGGCCGMEPHHIRAVAQELEAERGRKPPVEDMCPPFGKLLVSSSVVSQVNIKTQKDFWYGVNVASGRPDCPQTNRLFFQS